MRIIAGQNRGLRLAEIGKGDPAAHLRPTTDRVRESLFNVLRNWIDFKISGSWISLQGPVRLVWRPYRGVPSISLL